MTAELKKILESKRAARRDLASKPVGEKLRIVEELTERALLTRKDTAASLPDAPWEVPSTWRWKRMGEVAKIVGGGTPRTDRSEYFGGNIPWITPADLSGYTQKTISRGSRSITENGLANSGAQLLPAGTVLFSSRAPIGYVAIAANPVTTSQGFRSFVLSEELESDFVYYYLQHARQLAIAVASGTTFLEISGKSAARLPVPVPPVHEQKLVVAEIEKQFTQLDAAVVLFRRLETNLKRYRTAVLHAALEGRLVPTEFEISGRRQFESGDGLLARIYAERDLKRRCEQNTPTGLPLGWTYATVAEITRNFDGRRVPLKSADRETRQGPYPYYGASGIIDHIDAFLFEGEYLLIAEDGANLLSRSTPIAFQATGRFWVNNHAHILQTVGKIPLSYLQLVLNAKDLRFFVGGSAQPKLTQGALNKITVPLPPLAEQYRIVAEVERRLSVIGAIEKLVATNLHRAAGLRQSILERAFSGRLIKSNLADKSAAKTKDMSPASRRHFLRAVLSAEIVHQLHAEPTFGQTKHQKIFHLCEHIAEITDLDVQYHRDAAGPYDNRLIYANEAELKKQKWYESYSRKKVGHAYRPLAKAGGHEKYLKRYWPEKLETIRRLIHLMRRWDTERCEIFSTAYAAWNDLLLWGKEASDDAIVHEVLHRWHESKQRIPEERWRKALEWMRKEGFVPTGFGKPTAPARS